MQTVFTTADIGVIEARVQVPDESRYAELSEIKAPLAAQRDRLRARLDELTQTAEINDLRARLKELNRQLWPVDQELAAIARIKPRG